MKTGTRVRYARYRPAAVLRVSGEDALSFLQGQFTQELKTLGAGAAAYGLWLNQKGKVVADSFVLRADNGVWWLVSVFSAAAVIRERLESYIIADDVVIEDQTTEWEGVAAMGLGADAWLAGAPGWIWAGRRTSGASWEWLKPVGIALPGGEVEEVSAEELERARMEAGIPAVPQDVGPGDLPNEAGLENDAISYTKGCYLGQEVMARLKTMGTVRRRLVRVRGSVSASLPSALPAGLFHGEKRVGEVRSAVSTEGGWIGLAMVSLLGLDAETVLSLTAGGPADVRWEAAKS